MGAMANLLIGIMIALLPLFTKVAGKDFSRIAKDNLFVILVGVICLVLPKKRRRLPLSLSVAVAYALIFLVLNQWQPASVIVMLQTFYISAGILFFIHFYQKHSRESVDAILNGMAIGCLIQCLIVIFNTLGIPLYLYLLNLFYDNLVVVSIDYPGIGSLGNPGPLASYVALTSMALFRKKWCYLLALPVAALVIANSMMGYAALLAGAGYYACTCLNLKLKKPLLYGASIIAMFGAYLFGVNGADSNRFESWRKIFNMVDESHFFFGKGPGWYYDHAVFSSAMEKMVQEHNEFISGFNLFGVMGMCLLLPVFGKFLFTKDRSKIFPSVLFAAFISSYGHFTLHQSTVAIIILVTAAICLAEGKSNVYYMER